MFNPKKKKIAFITSFPLDLTIGSGVVRMIQGYRLALKRLGHQVTVFHPTFKATSYLNLTVQRLTFNKKLKIPEKEFDLIIVSDFDGFTLNHSGMPKFALNAGILADIVKFEQGESAKILTHLAQRECQNVQSADRVIVPSHYTARKIHEYYQVPVEKIAVIPLGIDLSYWHNLAQRVSRKNKNEIQILCVARQYPRKGIADLLKAFYYLRLKERPVQLVIVGGGPEIDRNKTLVRKLALNSRVTFLGNVANQQQLAFYYTNADIFCLPSYHETFGLVFLEAMFFNLPIVTYASTAIPEVVPGDAGFLCPPEDVECLTEKLLILVNDSNLRKQMGVAGHQYLKRFNWLESARKLMSLVESLKMDC